MIISRMRYSPPLMKRRRVSNNVLTVPSVLYHNEEETDNKP
jgi:hypothetical protein